MHSVANHPISTRQAEIADLVVSGKSNREIAETLFLSPRTVETHVAALFNKLGVRSRTELVAAVLRPAGGELAAHIAKTNLPLQVNGLVGRESEVATIAQTLQDVRLVTVTGTGGVGKTRTALHVGTDLAHRWGNGVWFVDLAPLGDPSSVYATVSLSLGIQESPNRPPIETILGYLKRKTLLLILDNCEHVIAEAANLADAILKSCPGVSILATSREPLKIEGEQSYRLPSLPVPTLDIVNTLRATQAAEYGAVTLFVERGQAVDHRFALTDQNAPIVVDIVRRLDGIPLAIELAAARVKILSVGALAKKLDERFRILGHGHRTALARHQTMRALFDWSYNLLSPAERRFFDCLSIFAGGCTLPIATAVCASAGTEEPSILELLESLVDKSLVVADLDGREPRYRILESSRQYAREKLAARGEHAAVAHRHAAAYLGLASGSSERGTPRRTGRGSRRRKLSSRTGGQRWSGPLMRGAMTSSGSVSSAHFSRFGPS